MNEQARAILKEYYRRLSADPKVRGILHRIEIGNADLADTAALSDRAADLLGEVFGAAVPDVPEDVREVVCEGLLRERYDSTMTTCDGVLEALDSAQGLHLTPQHPGFPIERVQQIAHSLLDPNAKPETIRRRANKPVATVAKSFHDDYIKTNARVRNDLGFKCYLDRVAAPGCCAWCTRIAGRYVYGDHPADIFRRHDNCSCTVTFENGRERQDVWSKRTWDAKDPKEIERVAARPAVMSRQQAENLQNTALSRLTLAGERDIMRVSGAVSGALNPYSEQADKHAERYYAAVRKMTTDVRRISENTGYSEELIQSIKDFVFNEKHDLGDRFDYFDPDYKMAQSWQRLIDGKNIQEHDLTLLKHEQMERELMRQGYTQSEAHLITSQKYNYDKEAKAYYDRNEKHSKE
jgi:hypothetical protein